MNNIIKTNLNNSFNSTKVELLYTKDLCETDIITKENIKKITTHIIYSKNKKLMKFCRLLNNTNRTKGNKKRYTMHIINIIESINTKINTQTDRNTLAQKYGNKSYSKTIRQLKKNIGKCQLTNKTNNLVVHHINSINKHPEMIVDESNLVVITNDVHKSFHNQFGYGNNNKEQWDKFVMNYKYCRQSIACEN